jgi:hypothetical protein
MRFPGFSSFFLTDQPADHVGCDLPISSFPGVIHEEGNIRFQCHGKKTSFFKIALVSQEPILAVSVSAKKISKKFSLEL